MHDVCLRTVGRHDLPQLIDLYRELIPGDPPLGLAEAESRLQQLATWPPSGIFICMQGSQVLSTCMLVVVPNLTRCGRPFALIENVVTRAPHRGRGFGKRVLAAAIACAWEADCYKAMLMTGSTRASTLGFYRAAGFEPRKTGFEIRNPS